MRRQPHVSGQAPILLSVLPHVIDSHGESSAGCHWPRSVVGWGEERATALGNGRRLRHDNGGGTRDDDAGVLPAREGAFPRDPPTRQIDRMTLMHVIHSHDESACPCRSCRPPRGRRCRRRQRRGRQTRELFQRGNNRPCPGRRGTAGTRHGCPCGVIGKRGEKLRRAATSVVSARGSEQRPR